METFRKAIALGFGLLGAVVSASAQLPDVRFRLDASLVYRSPDRGASRLRMVDPFGRPSILALTFLLEPGFQVYAAQRLQQIQNDADRDVMDEYYVEDPGIWRVGRQYLPFGTGRILRESVIAARGDTSLILENLPIAVALCDGGDGMQRGIVGRVGSRLGVSVALGERFGIAGTALNFVRFPEQSPGRRRGWGRALGLDYTKRFGPASVTGEWLALTDGATAQDKDLTLFDVSMRVAPTTFHSLTLGWTRQTTSRVDFYRIQAEVFATKNVWIEPTLRYRDSRFLEFSLGCRVRF